MESVFKKILNNKLNHFQSQNIFTFVKLSYIYFNNIFLHTQQATETAQQSKDGG